ncbi:hypothetical protein, partial [Paenibacillus sp. YN15]|uniref:hypothetical protein n=1 Tax=Paenibacillus sp. YN15 TaxID=1742774 RepID=UPI000DCB1236
YSNVLLRSYEALSYSGQKVGFVSEKQIAAGGLSAFKLLVVPYATRVDPATLSGIKAYMEQGGRVLLIGSHALELEPHGTAQSAEERSYVFAHADKITAANWTAAQIRSFLQPILEDIAPERMLLKETATGELPYNVEWRSTEHEGRVLLNVVNYGAETVLAAAEADGNQAVRYTNLITGQVHEGGALELEPLTPYLFAVEMGADNGNGNGGEGSE